MGYSFYGMGADKKKSDAVVGPPPIHSVKAGKGKGALPSWAPYAVGALGIAVVVVLLMTSKK